MANKKISNESFFLGVLNIFIKHLGLLAESRFSLG